jgi:hypothetical protein
MLYELIISIEIKMEFVILFHNLFKILLMLAKVLTLKRIDEYKLILLDLLFFEVLKEKCVYLSLL